MNLYTEVRYLTKWYLFNEKNNETIDDGPSGQLLTSLHIPTISFNF